MPHGSAVTCSSCGASLEGSQRCAACGAVADEDPYIGRRLGGRYEIRELIGIGGMGRVYKAVHLGLERMVAVKLISPRHLDNRTAAVRFMIEARAASRLNHPNVIAIHDFGGGTAEEPELYLVMELLDGISLGEVLHDGPMPIPRVTDVLCQVLAALHEAHCQGVTHRDIKPENVFIQPLRAGGDRVKLIDFGVAKLSAGTGVTQFGEVVGTPRYMSPEQARGEIAGPSADLYTVGVLMFEMLTGRRAFEGRAVYDIVTRILSAARPDPRQIAPHREIPDELAAVCIRAMALEPEDRYPSAEAFARAILDAVDEPWSPKLALMFMAEPSADAEPRRSVRYGAAPAAPATLSPPPLSAPPRSAPAEGSARTRATSRPGRPVSTPTPTEAPTPGPATQRAPSPASTRAPAPASQRAPSPGEIHRPTVRMNRVAPAPTSAPIEAPRVVEDPIRGLAEAFEGARRSVLEGTLDAGSGWAPVARQLGGALVGAGRVDEAYGVLREVLEQTDPRSREHALVAEQLAYVAEKRGRSDEMRALLKKALDITEALDDESTNTRLRGANGTNGSGVRAGSHGADPPASRRKTGGGRGT